MARSSNQSRTIVLWVFSLILTVAGTTAAGAAQTTPVDPLQLIPPESLFCVKINDLDATLGMLDQFLMGLAPSGASMAVTAQFARILGSADANSIDASGDFAAFGLLPGGEAPDLSRIGVLVPVTDYRKFVASNPNVAAPDAQGISRIGPEGQQKMVAADAGGYALVTAATNERALAEMKGRLPRSVTSLAKRLSPEESKRAADSPVWAYANIQAVHKTFGPMIQAKLQKAKETFKQMQAQGAPVMGEMDAIMDLYGTMLTTLMQETQCISLSIEPSASTMRVAFAAAAMPGTDMAAMLDEGVSPQQQANLLGYLENGALMNAVATPSPAFIKAVTLKRVELLTRMAGQTLSQDDAARLKKLATDSADAFAGPVAMSLSLNPTGKPPMRMKYVAVLRDKLKFNEVIDQVARMASEDSFAGVMDGFGLKMRIKVRRNAETYKNVSIDAIHLDMQPADANSPQGQMMAAMFGGGFDLRLAVVNNLMLYTLSPEPQKAICNLIDQAKAGGSTQAPSEVQAAMQLIPDAKQAEFFGTYNYPRAIQMAMALMPMPAPQVQIATQSNIAFSGDIGNGRLLVNLAIPKQHVLELMMTFGQIQRQKPPQQGQDGSL